jgi:hypothetical protein
VGGTEKRKQPGEGLFPTFSAFIDLGNSVLEHEFIAMLVGEVDVIELAKLADRHIEFMKWPDIVALDEGTDLSRRM